MTSTQIQTTEGAEIVTTQLEKKNTKKKFTEKDIELLQSDEIKNFLNKKQLPAYLKNKYNISISIGTLRKIWKGDY